MWSSAMNRYSISVLMITAHAWRGNQASGPIKYFLLSDYIRLKAITQGVIVWKGIWWDTRSPLVVFKAIMTTRSYVDSILTTVVLPMLSNFPGTIYHQDNARPHIAWFSQCCLQGYDTLKFSFSKSRMSWIHKRAS